MNSLPNFKFPLAYTQTLKTVFRRCLFLQIIVHCFCLCWIFTTKYFYLKWRMSRKQKWKTKETKLISIFKYWMHFSLYKIFWIFVFIDHLLCIAFLMCAILSLHARQIESFLWIWSEINLSIPLGSMTIPKWCASVRVCVCVCKRLPISIQHLQCSVCWQQVVKLHINYVEFDRCPFFLVHRF